MSDEPDAELLALLRHHIHSQDAAKSEPETGVLEDAEYVYDNGIDMAIDMRATKEAAREIYAQMQQRSYSTASWAEHELHPKTRDDTTVAFIFTMDLLNFSFWSPLPADKRFAVEYRGTRWTGYWSLVAALQRALDDGIPVTDVHFWQSDDECNMDTLRHIFRSCTDEEVPMLEQRLECLKDCGRVVYERYNCSLVQVVASARGSAARLVNILSRDFACFRDEHSFNGRKRPVRFLKRAQILVADLWACFQGESYGNFHDIDKITMFADYRVPQILRSLGALHCSPIVAAAIQDKQLLESGGSWEVQLRACSIWCIELIRREIAKQHAGTPINAILIDFFLYDKAKQLETQGNQPIHHHRTRSIWY
ncbi:hypothetical protein CDD81_1578 [Ophiocordyceps australis]|uniref:Queuosine 5'-phosphate N-glycosylase/hydrolase n=1 Tax=Ophiocordyceps australis TaxID=1399860 RepID=A0A2C5Y0X5_9HYPO|nr:hypothetical protein CDD81_1578 [Ophiocordyceps australis]